VWENTDPDFAFTLETAIDRDPAGFDLAVGHPSAIEGLKSEVTEGDGGSGLGISRAASAVALAELGSFGHQRHSSVLLEKLLVKLIKVRISVAIRGTTITAAIAAAITTTTATAISAPTISATVTAISAVIAGLAAGAVVFLLVDPALDTNDAVNGAGFGEAVVERDAESLKRDFAFAVSFSAGDVRTTEATGATEADAFGTEFHGGLQGAFHGAAEADPALKLHGDLLGHQLGVKLGLADLDDVDLDLRSFAEIADFLGHHFDFLALTTDDETGTGGVKCDADAVPSALDDNTG
jgi:hypothetical protein